MSPIPTGIIAAVLAEINVSSPDISVVGYQGIALASGNGPITLTPSVGASAGDIILLIGKSSSTSNVFTWPSGFTQNTETATDTVSNFYTRTAWKVATESEPSTYAVSGNITCRAAGIVIFRGVNTTPFDVTTTSTSVNTPTASPINMASTGLASGSPNRMLVLIDMDGWSTGATTVTTPPSGFNQIIDTQVYRQSVNFSVSYKLDAAGTDTSSPTAILTSSGKTGGASSLYMAFKHS